MTLSSLVFAALVWGSLAAVVGVFGYLLRVVVREAGVGNGSSGRDPEGES